jgi:nicotinic acid phosphoribosyltransferase
MSTVPIAEEPNQEIMSKEDFDKLKDANKNNPHFWEHPIFNTDSYKVSMINEYPPNVQTVYSYVEARAKGEYTHTLFYGLKAFIERYMEVPTMEQYQAAMYLWNKHFEGNLNVEIQKSWLSIVNMPEPEAAAKVDGAAKVEKRKMPLEIESVDEGTVVPIGLPLVSIKNTSPEYYWLTTWYETVLLRAIWYPTTVATQSKSIQNVFYRIYRNCGISHDDAQISVEFKLWDFGQRGVSSHESAGLGGSAHLINFRGSDTFSGAIFAQNYYDAKIGEPIQIGVPETDFGKTLNTVIKWATSVPATEHSTMTSWGRNDIAQAPAQELSLIAKEKIKDLLSKAGANKEQIESITSVKGEEAAYANMIASYHNGIVPVVSDSYDLFKAVYQFWGNTLKPLVIAKHKADELPTNLKKIVIRPDSGDPLITCCRLFVLLGLQFNDMIKDVNRLKLLEGLGVIQGDGVNEESVTNILNALTKVQEKFSVFDEDGNEYTSFADIVKITDEEKAAERKSPVLFGIFGVGNYMPNNTWSPEEKALYVKCKERRDKLTEIYKYKWHPDNIVFGMGGALLQKVHRDTQKWAMKCSSISLTDGKSLSVTKDPITDQGKKSKTGMVKLYSKIDNGKTIYTYADDNGLRIRMDNGNAEQLDDDWTNLFKQRYPAEYKVDFDDICKKSRKYNTENINTIDSFKVKKEKGPAVAADQKIGQVTAKARSQAIVAQKTSYSKDHANRLPFLTGLQPTRKKLKGGKKRTRKYYKQ